MNTKFLSCVPVVAASLALGCSEGAHDIDTARLVPVFVAVDDGTNLTVRGDLTADGERIVDLGWDERVDAYVGGELVVMNREVDGYRGEAPLPSGSVDIRFAIHRRHGKLDAPSSVVQLPRFDLVDVPRTLRVGADLDFRTAGPAVDDALAWITVAGVCVAGGGTRSYLVPLESSGGVRLVSSDLALTGAPNCELDVEVTRTIRGKPDPALAERPAGLAQCAALQCGVLAHQTRRFRVRVAR